MQPLLEGGDLAWRAVARDHDLLLRIVQGIEDVEELLLRAVLAGDELDVVHEQDVDGAVLLAEGGQSVEADGVDHLVDEAVRGDVDEVQVPVAGLDVVADGMHEVRLAEAHPAVEEQRVVGLAGDLGHRPRGGVGELVGGAHHEALEGVLGVEGGGGGDLAFGHGLGAPRRSRLALEDDVDLALAEVVQGLRDHAVVVAGQPVLELGVRDLDEETRALERVEARGPEPGGEAVAVHLGLDLGQHLVPEVHGPGLQEPAPPAWPSPKPAVAI